MTKRYRIITGSLLNFLQVELDYNVVAHERKVIFVYGLEWNGPHSLTIDMRGRQFGSLMAAGFCIGVPRNRLTHYTVLFSFPFPSFVQICVIT
jgi:hypothetical protein